MRSNAHSFMDAGTQHHKEVQTARAPRTMGEVRIHCEGFREDVLDRILDMAEVMNAIKARKIDNVEFQILTSTIELGIKALFHPKGGLVGWMVTKRTNGRDCGAYGVDRNSSMAFWVVLDAVPEKVNTCVILSIFEVLDLVNDLVKETELRSFALLPLPMIIAGRAHMLYDSDDVSPDVLPRRRK